MMEKQTDNQTVYVLVSEDGSQVLTNLDTGKVMAWEHRRAAEQMLKDIGDEYGPLHIQRQVLVD